MAPTNHSERHAVQDHEAASESDMDSEPYLERIGIDPSSIEEANLRTLERLQRAHVATVPFETLSITGDPFGAWDGERLSLSITDIYTKIVRNNRGGFCYELNGLFGWLLEALGFDLRRVSSRIASDGGFGPPADHLSLVVDLDGEYLVDVGLGLPKLRRPLPLDGESHVDRAGIGWRVSTCDRPDADYIVEYRSAESTEWETRFIFRDVPRSMGFFQATCEYFERAPDSHFTGDPVIILATERGHTKLSPTTVTRSVREDITERSIDQSDWYTLLDKEFELNVPQTGGS